MNYKAIDAGVDAVHKVEVPADWANATEEKKTINCTGRPATVKMVERTVRSYRIMMVTAFLYLHLKANC